MSAWPGKSASSLQTTGEVKSGASKVVDVGVVDVGLRASVEIGSSVETDVSIVEGASVGSKDTQLDVVMHAAWLPEPLHCSKVVTDSQERTDELETDTVGVRVGRSVGGATLLADDSV